MGKKTTAYSRKRKAGYAYNSLAFVNRLSLHRPYTDEEMPGGFISHTQEAADNARNMVNKSLGSLARGAWPADDTENFDRLAEAIGVTSIRCIQIGGVENNPNHEKVSKGSKALKAIRDRRVRTGKWGATRPEQIELAEAIEVYEVVLQASSPAQMTKAVEERMKILKSISDLPNIDLAKTLAA